MGWGAFEKVRWRTLELRLLHRSACSMNMRQRMLSL
jgi:hypothetical protein